MDVENKNMDKKNNQLDWKQEFKSLSVILLVALMIRVFVVEPFYIPSPSMQDTLLEGDYVFASKYDYGFSKYSMLFVNPDFIKGRVMAKDPQRGDIIIFRPPHQMEKRYIKRLIGLPGDRVQLKNSLLYINGTLVPREEIGYFENKEGSYIRYVETLPNGLKYHVLQLRNSLNDEIHQMANNTPEFVVPEGQYFFLGDNRDQSGDSRFQLGFVPFENFIAKARFFYFSSDNQLWLKYPTITTQIKQAYYWISSLRFGRFFKSVYSL